MPQPIVTEAGVTAPVIQAGPRWGKVSTAIVRAIYGQPRASLLFAVVVAIAAHVNNRTGTAWPSLDRLAQEVGVTPETVSKGVQGLIKLGILSAQRRRRDTSIYRVNLDPPPSVKSRMPFELAKSRLDSPPLMRFDSPPVVKQTEKRTKNIEQRAKREDDEEVERVL